MTAPSDGAFLRSIAILLTGTVASQVLVVGATPLLTRLYSASDFGLAAVYVSLISVFGVIAALRYDIAIPVARDEPTGDALLPAAFAAALMVGLVLGVLSLTAGPALLVLLNAEPLIPFLWLLPLGVTMTGIQQTLMYWALREGSAGSVAKSRVSQSVALVSGQLVAGGYGAGALGLIASHPVGRAVGAGLLAQTVPWRRMKTVGPRDVVKAFVVYRRFPLFSAWSGIINVIGLQAPIFLLSMIFGSAIAGVFFLTVRVLQSPVAVAGQAVGQAFFSHASRSSLASGRTQYATQTYEGMLALAAGPALLVVAAGRPAFAWLFGPDWSLAGDYAAWLAPWILLVFAASPISTSVLLTSRQGTELALQVAFLLLRSAALIVGAAMGGPEASVALFGAVSFLLWLPYAVWLMSLNAVAPVVTAWVTIRSLAVGAVAAAPAGLAIVSAQPVAIVVAAGLISAGVYLANLRLRYSLFSRPGP